MASVASEFKFDLRFEISNLNYPGIHVHIAYNSHFCGLLGHGGPLAASMAPEVKFDFRFLISYLNYPAIHVHNAHNNHFGGLWGHGSLQTVSEAISDLRIGLSDLNYTC